MKDLISFSFKDKPNSRISKKPITRIITLNTLALIIFMVLILIMVGCSSQTTTAASQTAVQTITQTPTSSKWFTISGASMEPTLHNGDKVKAYELYREIKRGDIIVYTPPDKDYFVISRIIGMPNENIEIKDGQVFINGTALAEPYIMEPISYILELTTIPKNSYYILGDNRNISTDSHNYGAVPLANIKYVVEIQ